MKEKLGAKFFAAAFTLTGTIIGAGILGLPYIFSKSGFFIGTFWLAFLGMIMLFVNLAMGEVSLRTKKIHQLPGYAEKYLGKTGKIFMLFAVIFGIYSALLAYLVGEGQSLSNLFFGNSDCSVYFAIGFWLCMILLFREGLRELKRVELFGVIFITAIILAMLLWFFPQISLQNLTKTNYSGFFLPFGIILFALLGFTAITEMRMEISGNEKILKKAILLGSAVPVALYFIFALIFVGVLGDSVSEVATISLGKPVMILGILTMMTSYFAFGFVLKDMLVYDIGKRKLVFPMVVIFPIAGYLLLTFFNLSSFADILAVGGIVSGGIMSVLILLMNIKAKKSGDRKPEFSVPMNWIILLALSLVFILGIFS